jgi:hypothetical protein
MKDKGERISILQSFLMLTLLADLKTDGMKYLAVAPVAQISSLQLNY